MAAGEVLEFHLDKVTY
ncbi:Protein of unknown function [Lactobacillus helveticus CIRM-BIA 101]|uniref:Uncharacterized protein n=1 Tax=Lactobacillus helveticus CIRM-BIA 104 TaxID=1226333 RepID=U6F800_LACHE|nr:Protein of unknown function [Lactobacillus helveticus CIRM-BIA 104]CDI65962.1 Protein of unknown function [Lactobacillus helveticus CIRM-BIA 101]